MNAAVRLYRRQLPDCLTPSWVTQDPMLADDFPRA